MIDFFKRLFGIQPPASGATAKERLRLVLLSDHLSLAPDVVDSLKRDLLEVISRYVEIDESHADVTFEHRDREIAMLASVPIRAVLGRTLPPPARPAAPAPSNLAPVLVEAPAVAVAPAEPAVASATPASCPNRWNLKRNRRRRRPSSSRSPRSPWSPSPQPRLRRSSRPSSRRCNRPRNRARVRRAAGGAAKGRRRRSSRAAADDSLAVLAALPPLRCKALRRASPKFGRRGASLVPVVQLGPRRGGRRDLGPRRPRDPLRRVAQSGSARPSGEASDVRRRRPRLDGRLRRARLYEAPAVCARALRRELHPARVRDARRAQRARRRALDLARAARNVPALGAGEADPRDRRRDAAGAESGRSSRATS